MLREHLQLLAMVGAFQQLPPSMLQGADAIMATATAVFSVGYSSADSIHCVLQQLGGRDRNEDLVNGIPASSSEVLILVQLWVVVLLILIVWVALVQVAIMLTSESHVRGCFGNKTVDAVQGWLGLKGRNTSEQEESSPLGPELQSNSMHAILASRRRENPTLMRTFESPIRPAVQRRYTLDTASLTGWQHERRISMQAVGGTRPTSSRSSKYKPSYWDRVLLGLLVLM